MRFSSSIPWIVSLHACFALQEPVHAQRNASSPERDVRFFIGGGLGGGAFPGALQPECHFGLEGRTPAVSADLRIGVELARVRLETRTAKQGSIVFEDCLVLGPRREEGVHTTRTPLLERGSFTVTDVRVGYVRGASALQWRAWGGLGWTWGRDIPVLEIGAGIHLGRTIRGVIEADLVAYRIPWDVLTAEWRAYEIVREIDRRRDNDWRSGYSVRLGVEIAPRLFR